MLDGVAVGVGIFETVEDAGCRIRTGDPLNPIQLREDLRNFKLSVFQGFPSIGAGTLPLKCRDLPEETAPQTAPRSRVETSRLSDGFKN